MLLVVGRRERARCSVRLPAVPAAPALQVLRVEAVHRGPEPRRLRHQPLRHLSHRHDTVRSLL